MLAKNHSFSNIIINLKNQISVYDIIVDSAWKLKTKCVYLSKDFKIIFDDAISIWKSREKIQDLK